MYQKVLGEWPKQQKLLLVSCDEKYFNKYFPRFYKTFSDMWQMPIHVHIIDPSTHSLKRLNDLGVTHTWCDTKYYNWTNEVKKYKEKNHTQNPAEQIQQWLYECYCQCQRFIVLGAKMLETQSVVVADIDAYALNMPTNVDKNELFNNTCFTKHNGRLMATFCHFHPNDIVQVRNLGNMILKALQDVYVIGMDQYALKNVFAKSNVHILNNRWIRHQDVKNSFDLKQHNSCLVYHEKGTRGKEKGITVEWTDIE